MPSESEWPEIYRSDNPKGELRNILVAVKLAGYEIHIDSNEIVGIAAPLFRAGHVVGSMGVYMPKTRYNNEEWVLSQVLNTAKTINLKIEQTDRIKNL